MNCPKCGHQNPDNVLVCESCGFDLINFNPPKPKAKTNKKHIYSLILIIPSAILFMLLKPTLAFIVALLGFCSTFILIIKNRKRKKENILSKAIGIILFTFFSLQMLIMCYWRVDAPPIPNDYTINDIKSAPPEYNQSYELLLSIEDSNIALSEEDVINLWQIYDIFSEDDLQTISNKLQEKESDILVLWDKAKKGRSTFAKLDSFPEIVDLSEPILNKQYPVDKTFRQLVFLYRIHICLQSIKGNHELAFNELKMLDSIFKKMTLNNRSFVMKLFCIACFNQYINSANFIINNPETPNEILLSLKDQIESLSDEHTSLKNVLIFEYITCKNELNKMADVPKLKYSSFSPLKYNSSLRFLRNYYDEWIVIDENQKSDDKFRIWPVIYPDLPVEFNNEVKLDSIYYKIYNPVGYVLIEIVSSPVERIILIKKRFEVHYDMLKVVLNARLGEEVDLKALDYGDDYIIDIENKTISYNFSARKVKSSHEFSNSTMKDIVLKLRINPEVLGFTE